MAAVILKGLEASRFLKPRVASFHKLLTYFDHSPQKRTHRVVKALGNLYKLSEENPFLKFMLSLLMWASVDKEAEQLGVAVPEHTVPPSPLELSPSPRWLEQGTRAHTS